MSIKTIVLASNNAGKINEIKLLLSPFGVEIKSLKDLGLGDPIENGKDFIENSLIKAEYAFEKTGLPSLADDSGFCIDSLNNFPGLFSSRFGSACRKLQNDLLGQNIDIKTSFYGEDSPCFKIINNMIGEDKKAHFTTCISFVYKNDDEIKKEVFEGIVKGDFIYPPRGKEGFGYDPCFMPNGYDKTFAEMGMEAKNKISHRSIALAKFVEYFKKIK